MNVAPSEWALRIARHAVHTCGAIQDEVEMAALLDVVRQKKPKVVVELGTAQGGMFYGLCQAAREDAWMISVDLGPYNPTGALYSTPAELESKRQGPLQVIFPVYGNTHDFNTQQQLKAVLGRRKIDVLFIDADHHYEAVRQDDLDYSPLVRVGGLVGFHDIVRDNFHQDGCEVSVYWPEVKEREKHRIYEFVNGPAFGIGAYTK